MPPVIAQGHTVLSSHVMLLFYCKGQAHHYNFSVQSLDTRFQEVPGEAA